MRTVKLKLLVVCIVVGLFGGLVVSPAEAVTVLYQRPGVSPGVSIYLGETFNSLEFENPPPAPGGLIVGKHVKGYRVLEWLDADYNKPGYPLYDDWGRVGGIGTVDGNINEVWMRQSGQAISTTTTVPSTAVSIHLTGDNNDGKAEVRVRGTLVATLDMGTRGFQRALIIVRYLPLGVHTIRVDAVGLGPSGLGTDVATMGACALEFHKYFPHFWYLDCRLRLFPTPVDHIFPYTAIPLTIPNGYWGGPYWWHHQCSWYRPWYGSIWRYRPYSPWPPWRWRLYWWHWPHYKYYYGPWWNYWKWQGGPWFWGFKKCFHYTWRPWWRYNPWPWPYGYPWKPPIIYMWSWYWDPGGQGNTVEMFTMADEDNPAGGRILPVTDNVMTGLTVTEHNFTVNNKITDDFGDLYWVDIGDPNGHLLRDNFASMTGAEPNDVNDFMESDIVQELLKNNTEGGGGGRVGLQYASWMHTDAIPELEVTAASIVLNEAETYEYTVVPTGPYTSDANVCIIPSSARLDLGNGEGNPLILEFNTENWGIAQYVNVMLMGDDISQGTETLFIGHSISTDPNTGISVQVTAQDNELGGWGFTEGDINQDGKADLKDFAQFANDYLQCTDPQQP